MEDSESLKTSPNPPPPRLAVNLEAPTDVVNYARKQGIQRVRRRNPNRQQLTPDHDSSADESDFEERRQRLDIYSQHWMNSCLNETVLPGSPWHKLMAKVVPAFAARLKDQFGDKARKEAIFQLLGPNFVERFLPNEKRDALALLELSEGDRRKIVRDAADFLNAQWNYAAEAVQCQRVPPSEDVDPKASPEMADFLTHVYRIFYVGLDRSMYVAQAKEKRGKEKQAAAAGFSQNGQTIPKIFAGRISSQGFHPYGEEGASTARSLIPLETSRPANDKDGDDNLAVNTETAAAMNVAVQRYKKNVALPAHARMPPLSSEYSDQMGNSVVALLQRDPRRLTDVVCKLHGRQLPKTLRIYLWLETLLRKEREKTKQLQVERILRENFGRAITRGLTELNLKKPTQSPIATIIENALTETYKRSPGLHASFNDSHLKDAAEALNAFYISERSYEVHMIFWLYPLQLTFEDVNHQPEHPLDLALYLQLFRRDVFPGWDECRKVAEKVCRTLQDQDVELATHLEDVCRRQQLIKQQSEKSSEAAVPLALTGPSLVRDEGLKGLEPFVNIIYSWVSEGFVGVLDGHGVLFAWDQLMMFSWNTRVLEHLTLAIVMLLRHRFLEAFDFEGLQEIMVQEPNILYTIDLQSAFVFIEHNDNLLEASNLNRQKKQFDELMIGSQSARFSARDRGYLTSLDTLLPRFGLRDLEIQLIIPNHCLQKYQWLYDLDVSKFSILLSTYCGAIHMGNFKNAKPPFARDSATNSAGDVVHVIRFLDEFVGGPYTPKNFIDRNKGLELLRRSGGLPNVFLALVYNGDFPLKSEETTGALFGWTQIGAWQTTDDNKAWQVPNDVKWYSLQTAKLALALAPLAALAEKNILIDTEYASHFSHLTVEIFNPGTAAVAEKLFDKLHKDNGHLPVTGFKDQLEPIDFAAVRQVVPQLPPSGGWVRHAVSLLPDESSYDFSETFDFYVDAARFLPDSCTITMCHLNFANSGSVAAPENVLFLSHLDSQWRSPYYNGRVVINEKRKRPTKDMLAILTIVAVDRNSGQPFVVGTAIFALFKENPAGKTGQVVLRHGGHQVRLIQGIAPTPDKRMNTIPDDVLINFMAKPVVPGASVLIRLLPHENKFVDVPLYASGYYHNEESFVPTQLEEAIMTVAMEEDRVASENSENKLPPSVRDACHFVMKMRQEKPSDFQPSAYGKWMQQRCIKNGQFPDHLLPSAEYFSYTEMAGVGIKFGRLMNAKDDGMPAPSRLHFCSCKLFDPKSVPQVANGTRRELYGLEIDIDSPAQQLAWVDPAQTIYPVRDNSVVMMFIVYRLKADYIVPAGTSEKDILRPGALRSLNEGTLQDPPREDDLVQVGWAVVPIFKNNSVFEQLNLVLNMVPGAPPDDPELVLPTFVKNNSSSEVNKHLKVEVSIADGRRASELKVSQLQKKDGPTVRAILTQHIAKLLTDSTGQQGPPDAERVKYHVDCCLRNITAFALFALTGNQ